MGRIRAPAGDTRRTVQARLLGVHFYLEAQNWPSTFMFNHEDKIMTLQNAGCPLSVLPQRDGKPYVREHFLLLFVASGRLAVAMIDLQQPGMLSRLRVFIRQYLPLLRYLRDDLDLLVVTTDTPAHRSANRCSMRSWVEMGNARWIRAGQL
jgi:hypothetical protein